MLTRRCLHVLVLIAIAIINRWHCSSDCFR